MLQDKRITAFSGIGFLVGVKIGGTLHGIGGAMAGAVLGVILINSGIEIQVRELKAKGKFRPFRGAVVLAYVLALLFTIAALRWVPLLYSGRGGMDMIDRILLHLIPAFAGGIGALTPLWLSAAIYERRLKSMKKRDDR